MNTVTSSAKFSSGEQKKYSQIYTLPKNANLDSILDKHKGATILVFYADWCEPCREVKPWIERRAVQLAQNSKELCPRVIRINLDHHHELADKYAVFSIPTMVLLENGYPVEYLQPRDKGAIDYFFMKAEVIGYA